MIMRFHLLYIRSLCHSKNKVGKKYAHSPSSRLYHPVYLLRSFLSFKKTKMCQLTNMVILMSSNLQCAVLLIGSLY